MAFRYVVHLIILIADSLNLCHVEENQWKIGEYFAITTTTFDKISFYLLAALQDARILCWYHASINTYQPEIKSSKQVFAVYETACFSWSGQL